jgi:hypothetical protein
MHLKRWTAKRSGAGIRVTGFDTQLQKDAKLQAVSIEPRRGGLVAAIDKDGNEHTLALE